MKNRLRIASVLILLLALIFLHSSCSKSSQSDTRLQVRMVDNPIPGVKAVWVDIRQVEIIVDGRGPVVLDAIHPGVYNLLELTNGKDTLLADATLPSGKVSQLRLILGDNNYIVTNTDEKLPLKTPSAMQSGLKVQIHETLTGGILYRLTLDFDVARSIVLAGNSGDINLKPVLRILSLQPSGGDIKGVVLPGTTASAVYAINGTDTVASTFTAVPSGGFLIKDIPAGNYQLLVVPGDATFRAFQTSAAATLGKITVIDTIHLQPQ